MLNMIGGTGEQFAENQAEAGNTAHRFFHPLYGPTEVVP
jgi:hypothetical protein